jgi:hypothetical protein
MATFMGNTPMPYLPELADRVWFALHCLPRDADGKPPTYTELENKHGLHHAVLSKTILGDRKEHSTTTYRKLAAALNTTVDWLELGGKCTLKPTGVVPPRPGRKWMRHGDLPTWRDGVAAALNSPQQYVPPAAFRAGAELPVYKPVDTVTAEVAVGVAWYAWATCDEDEQTFYSTEAARHAYAGDKRPRAITKRTMKLASK